MNKALTILSLVLLTVANTKNAQAQTKEETIAWLKDKLNNSTKFIIGNSSEVRSNFSIKKIDECSIVFTYKYSGYTDTNDGDYEQTLPVKDVKINEQGRLYYSSEVVFDRNISKGKNSFTNKSEFEIVETEPDLRNRILKALKHLSTFCIDKKQAF